MMNWIIGAIVAAVIVVGGGYYLLSNSGSLSMDEGKAPITEADTTGDGVDDAVAPAGNTGSVFTGTWMDLAARGGTYTCTIAVTGKAEAQGKVYVSGKNVRGDFTSLVSGKSVQSSVLKLGDTVYVWGGGMPQGVMMSASASTGSAGAETSGSGMKLDTSYQWDCAPSTTDASKFERPNGIDFIDVSKMMQGAGVPSSAMPKVPAGVPSAY